MSLLNKAAEKLTQVESKQSLEGVGQSYDLQQLMEDDESNIETRNKIRVPLYRTHFK